MCSSFMPYMFKCHTHMCFSRKIPMLGLAGQSAGGCFLAPSLESSKREVLKIFHLSRATSIVISKCCYLLSPLSSTFELCLKTFAWIPGLISLLMTVPFFLGMERCVCGRNYSGVFSTCLRSLRAEATRADLASRWNFAFAVLAILPYWWQDL